MLPTIIGLIILIIVVFTAIRLVKNVLVGVALVALTLLGAYLLLGFVPSIRSIPMIGPLVPKVPTSLMGMISWIMKFLQNIDIIEVSRDSKNKLLITVENTGKLEVSNFTVYVDDNKVSIIHKPKDPLKSGEITIIQANWQKDFSNILIQTSRINATYSK